jgi:hypothetical protein
MTTAALPPIDLPGMILDHAARVEASCSEAIRQVQALASAKSKVMRMVVLQARLVWLADRNTVMHRKLNADFVETAIWFRGARATIEDGSMKLNEDNSVLLAGLEGVMEKTRELRAIVLDGQATLVGVSKSKSLRASRTEVVQRLAATLADLFAVLEGCRWAVLEREADDDIAAGRVSPAFTNAADAIAFLNANA